MSTIYVPNSDEVGNCLVTGAVKLTAYMVLLSDAHEYWWHDEVMDEATARRFAKCILEASETRYADVIEVPLVLPAAAAIQELVTHPGLLDARPLRVALSTDAEAQDRVTRKEQAMDELADELNRRSLAERLCETMESVQEMVASLA